MPTGTLVIPAEADVRLGTQYGADGTEYTGTLYVPEEPAAGTVDMIGSLRAIVRQLPDKVEVGYQERQGGDTFATAVTFEARRQPYSSGDVSGMAQNTATWQLYSTEGQTVEPRRGGKITDADGLVWQVAFVRRQFANLVHNCDCVLNRG